MNDIIKRNSGIDLLKIIAVIMISTVHFMSKGILYSIPFGSFNTIVARIIESLAIVCINVLILSTGYFSIKSNGINIRRITDIIIMVAFFSGLSYVIYACLGEHPFTIKEFLKNLFPYLFDGYGYWFIRVYLELCVLSPFLNILLNKLNKKGYITLLIFLFITFSILSSFDGAFKGSGGYDIIHFLFIYSIGAFIRLFIQKKHPVAICFVAYIVFSISTFLFSIFGNDLGYWAYDFPTVILQSISLFLLFAQFNFSSKPVSYFAKSSLAIFACENSIHGLYTDIMRVNEFSTSKYFLLHYVACIILFAIFAFSVDSVRRLIFRFTVDKVLDKIPFLNKRWLTDVEKSQ